MHNWLIAANFADKGTIYKLHKLTDKYFETSKVTRYVNT